MLENGWTFDSDFPAATGDELYHHDFLYQLYLRADPHYTGRVTVPVLWDKKNQTIVSNDPLKSFACSIPRLTRTAPAPDYYPVELREKIDELNGWIYDNVNNGVYKAGFATSQEAYDEAVGNVFGSGAHGQILGQHRYLTGDHHGSRHPPVDDADPLRSGVCHPLQVRQASHQRLSEPARFPARHLSDAGDCGDGQF